MPALDRTGGSDGAIRPEGAELANDAEEQGFFDGLDLLPPGVLETNVCDSNPGAAQAR